MGSSSKGESGTDYNQVAGQNAYTAASQGQNWETILGNSAGYEDAARKGYDQYAGEQSQTNMWEQFMSGFGQSQTQSSGSSGPSYEEQMAEQQAAYDKQQEEARWTQGLNDRDLAFSEYMDAAGTAADYVTGEIAKEQSNANLLGVGYSITDDQKTTRINDYFASIWGEGQQTNLEALMGEFGNPEGFSGFSVTRGDPSVYAEKAQGQEETISTSKGIKPKSSIATEEDTLGAPLTALGGI